MNLDNLEPFRTSFQSTRPMPTPTQWLGQKAADVLGLTRQIRPGEWRGPHSKLKKGEHEPGVIAAERTLSIWWKSGAMILYVDTFPCLENQDLSECMIISPAFVDEPPEGDIEILLRTWNMTRIDGEVRNKLEFLKENPGFRHRTPKTPQKRVAPRDQ